MPLVRARPLSCRIGSGDELGRDRRGRPERRVVERGEIFARGANRIFLKLLWSPVLAWNRALLVGVGGDEARVNRKPRGPDQALRHAALNDALKQLTQRIALAKAAMPVLGKGRVIRNFAVEPDLPVSYDHRRHDGAETRCERKNASDEGLPVVEQIERDTPPRLSTGITPRPFDARSRCLRAAAEQLRPSGHHRAAQDHALSGTLHQRPSPCGSVALMAS